MRMSALKYVRSIVKSIIFFAKYILYEATYYFLGGQAIIEDIIMRSKNKCDIIEKKGSVAVVTGGSRGIGANLVAKLMQCNMNVIIGCRNVDAGQKAVQRIRERGISTGFTYIFKLDLNSFQSIRAFANKVSSDFNSIDLLVNNAGIMFPPYSETEEGHESQWGINYLGPFLLSHLLLPLLDRSPEGRIVNVTSCAHVASKPIRFKNVNMRNSYIPSAAYAQSKLAQILFTAELNKVLQRRRSQVKVFAVHPGVVDTEIFNGTILKILMPWVLTYLCKDADAGATSVLYPCISPDLSSKSGSYLSNCTITTPSRLARKESLQKELFNYSLKTIGAAEFGKA